MYIMEGVSMRRYAKPILLLVLAGAVASGCAHAPGPNAYESREVNQAAVVERGRIVSMRPVSVEGTGRTGTLVGGAAGGVAGSFIGGDWRSNLLAGIAGAVVGGVAGNAAERSLTATTATEFIVELERGGTIAVVQGNEDGLRVGDTVTVLRGQRTRLTPSRG
jgi:outer membrane lipoprotein SlyB